MSNSNEMQLFKSKANMTVTRKTGWLSKETVYVNSDAKRALDKHELSVFEEAGKTHLANIQQQAEGWLAREQAKIQRQTNEYVAEQRSGEFMYTTQLESNTTLAIQKIAAKTSEEISKQISEIENNPNILPELKKFQISILMNQACITFNKMTDKVQALDLSRKNGGSNHE